MKEFIGQNLEGRSNMKKKKVRNFLIKNGHIWQRLRVSNPK
jgi:hypothetical protein